MIRFEGEKTFPLPVAKAAERLSDAGYLVRCLDDVDSIERAEPDVAVWKLRPKLSFLTGGLEVTATVTERVAQQSARLQVVSKGVGSRAVVAAELHFAGADGAAQVHWQLEVTELGGLLKLVPRGLMQATAGKVIDDCWAAVEKKLLEESA
jgi:carbon monoxide dehydrogenase subunit G